MDEATKQLAEKITRECAQSDQLIEGGWKMFELLSLNGAPEVQKQEMRKAFFLGAQHLFASIMSILEPGQEPTANDLKVMDLIQTELEKFTEWLRNENNRKEN